MRKIAFMFAISILTVAANADGAASFSPDVGAPLRASVAVFPIERVAGWSCKRASSCADAVRAWCGGYTRADGDHDGIPCENVCGSLSEVNRIRKTIGC